MTSPQNSYSIGKKEKRFNGALKDLFVGAKVDGESGYINLMRIKAAYYEKIVAPQLFEDVGAALKEFPGFREELFDKLHAFFTRYFSKSGSICFAYTPNHMSVYEKVYTDEQDVVLFWKTHMLYYVKSDRLFRDLKVEEDGQKFFFDCTHLEHKKNNEKRALIFSFDQVEPDGTVRLGVTYSERGRVTKTEDMLKALKKAKSPVKEATLLRAFKVFERQSEIDFFINKDARSFLREQFDLWMYQYLFADGTAWNHGRIRQLQGLKDIALKLIDFIAQFEDELVRIWNKPKFVRGSHYVITLDRIAAQEGGLALLADFLKDKGMAAQVEEWQALGIVDKQFDPKAILSGKGKTLALASEWRFLPLDTIHFKDLELPLLALFDDLDKQLDGRLIKSENYQALNTLKDKFKGCVKCCYIDPPYNTGGDGFRYSDSFKHASWTTMLQERIAASHLLLSEKGTLYSSIDDKERRHLEFVLDGVFGRQNRVEELIWVQNTTKNQSPTHSTNHEYVEVYARDLKAVSADKRIFREPKPGYGEMMDLVEKLNSKYPSIAEIEAAIQDLFKQHREEFRAELEEQDIEYDKNLDLWKGLYNYSQAEYRDADGKFVEEEDAKAKKATIWIWQEADASMPSGKQSPTTKEAKDPNFRFYRPLHPLTKNECPHPKRGWGFPKSSIKGSVERTSFEDLVELNRIYWGENEKKTPRLKKFIHEVDTQVAKSVVVDYTNGETELSSLFKDSDTFSNPKPTTLISRFILQTTDENEWVMDFFAGSGTTAHAVAEAYHTDRVRRKFLLVEAAEHFENTLLPRVKKVFAAKNWKSGKPVALDGPGLFCKVSSLEQYEDAVAGSVYYEDDAQADLFRNTKTNPYSQYVFFRDPKMARALELDYEKNTVHPHLERLYPDIDLAETLSCVTGKWIQGVTADEVVFTDGSRQSLQQPDWRLLKPLIFWGPIV